MDQKQPKIEPDYMGDGVYASFDGYHIALSVGDHRNPPAVFLEPQVFQALMRYGRRVDEAYGTERFKA